MHIHIVPFDRLVKWLSRLRKNNDDCNQCCPGDIKAKDGYARLRDTCPSDWDIVRSKSAGKAEGRVEMETCSAEHQKWTHTNMPVSVSSCMLCDKNGNTCLISFSLSWVDNAVGGLPL